jgi:hypothetical protein
MTFEKKEEKEKSYIFQKSNVIRRDSLLNKISQSPVKIKNQYGIPFSREEEKKLWEEIFPRNRFGDYIYKEEVLRRLKELKKEMMRSKTYAEKNRLDKLIKYIQEETGLEI